MISISSTAMLARDLQRRLARQAPAANAAGGLLAAAPVARTRPPRASWCCWDVCSASAGLPGTGQEWHSMVLQQGA